MQFKALRSEPQFITDMKPFVNWGTALVGGMTRSAYINGSRVKVAVLDSGIAKNHPDLNVVGGYNFTIGHRDDWDDREGHGTHCAGIIAGLDNGTGVTGIAPGVQLYAVKVLNDNGYGDVLNIMKGINWCIENDIDVISMSMGVMASISSQFHALIKKAYQKNITIVCAAGNDGGEKLYYPAAYRETLAVGALTPAMEKAMFSNRGAGLDVVAPGVNIISTWPPDKYAEMSGTSMAAPIVAGAVALYIDIKRMKGYDYTVKQIHEDIRRSCVDLGAGGHDVETGYGMINIPRLIRIATKKEWESSPDFQDGDQTNEVE